MRTVPLVAIGAGLAGAAAAATAVRSAERRWAAAPDPTGGRPLCEPPAGRPSVVRTPDGAELAVLRAGPEGAPTVVLVHCWTGDRRVWGTVATRLAEDHHVVLYDHRGHGRSTVGTAPLTLDTLADDLRLVLEHVDARDAVLAGHSMGGMTVQALALRHPDVLGARVAGLALVATAGHGVGTGSGGRVGPAVNGLPFMGPVLASGSLGRAVMRGAVGEVACRSHIDGVIETFAATAPGVRAGFQRALLAMDFRTALPSVDLPVVVLSGTRDNVTPHPLSQSLAQLLPNARLVTLPGLGHMLPWEAPDRVVTEIAALAAAAPVVAAFPPPSVG